MTASIAPYVFVAGVFLVGAGLGALTLMLWACLVAASDADDEMEHAHLEREVDR